MSQPDYLTPNTVLGGRYVITRHLGGGGFGQTYLAHDRQLPGNPQCVVKQFKPQLTEASALQIARRLFNTEAEVLYQLGNHDQIPRLLAHFEENQQFFLVQEFVEGHSLEKELIPGQKLSEAQTVSILEELLEVVAFVHQENVIHRDIKPSNIIRRARDRKLVLIDFGAVKQIATKTAIEQGKSALTVAIGTPGYMPNEQSNGKPRPCSDIYAIGMIGIQALTGLTPEQLPENPHTGELVWQDQAQASPKLKAILDRMVRYDFRQRYVSAIEARQALLDPDPIEYTIPPTLPLSGTSRSQKTEISAAPVAETQMQKRFPKPWLIGGGIVGAAIAGAAALTTHSFQPQITPSTNTSNNSTSPQSQPSTEATTITKGANSEGQSIERNSQATAPIQSPSPQTPTYPTRPERNPESTTQSPSIPAQSSPISGRWQFMGAAATGEQIYLDSASIRGAKQARTFVYKIGEDSIEAKADCDSNSWFAKGYGSYSPKSQATQSMLNYVCSYNPRS